MSRFAGIRYSVASLFRRGRADQETAEEIADYIERQTQKHIAAGMSDADASRLAQQEFGGAQRWREETGDARAGRFLEDIAHDARYAIRMLRRHRLFAAVSILTLAVGIGGSTAAVALVNGILWKPLPYPAPDRLVSIVQATEHSDRTPFSIPNLVDFTAASRSYAAIGAGLPSKVTVGDGQEAVDAQIAQVAGTFLEALAARPQLGRLFLPADAQASAPLVVVLSDELWRGVFGGDPSIVGKRITVNGGPYTVVGVMRPRFDQPAGTKLWMVCRWCVQPPPASRATMSGEVVARLRDGVSVEQAAAEAEVIAARLRAEYPRVSENQMRTARVLPLHEAIVGDGRQSVWMVGAALGFILLIGCANLAGTNLARNTSRIRELALRSALGAARGRIVRQLAVESLVVAVAGALLGLIVASWAVRLLARYGGERLPRISEIAIGTDSVLAALTLALLTALFIGVMPALRLSSRELRSAIGAQGIGTGARGSRLRNVLVSTQIALSLVLVVGAGLTARSLQIVEQQPIGVETGGLLTIEPTLSYRKYGAPGRAPRYFAEMRERLEAVPGVRGAAFASTEPLGMGWNGFIEIEGRQPGEQTGAQYNLVSENFFSTLGIKLLQGRLFVPSDDSLAVQVSVIDQTMAERYWPGQNPLGKRFKTISIGRNDRWFTVIGVVSNIRSFAFENGLSPTHYVSLRQRPGLSTSGRMIVRASVPPATIIPAMRRAAVPIDPSVRIRIRPFDERVREVTADRRITTSALSSFAAIALLLAAIGVYGLLSYTVALRTREIGVRLALGASRGQVLRQTLARIVPPVVIGLAAGVAGTRMVSKVLESLVFGLTPTDPAVLAAGCASVMALALLAAYLPAHRAASVDPLKTLRSE